MILNIESKNKVCLDIRNVTFSYRGADVLKDVNLTLTGGSVVGIVGPNGVGKTTLLSILVGDLIPNKGTVRINGTMVDGISDRSKVFGIALPTYGFTPSSSVKNALLDLRRAFNVPTKACDQLIQRFRIQSFLKTKIGKLSAGMRKKFELVAAAMSHPQVLILDEPSNGLDMESVDSLKQFIDEQRNHGTLILISSHVLPDLDMVADELVGVYGGEARLLSTFEPGVKGSAESSYKTMTGHEDNIGQIRGDRHVPR